MSLAVAGLLVVAGCAGPQGRVGPVGPVGPALSEAELLKLVNLAVMGPEASANSLAAGARLYDEWWKEAKGATEPKGDNPLWASQTTNKESGSSTWRCKECHGWDYKGKGGAYSKGSPYTGFPGVYDVGITKSKTQLLEALKGATDYRHDFSKVIPEDSLKDLANFLSEGLINETPYIDYATKEPIGANPVRGKELFDGACAVCHGSDGKMINFGSAEEPEYVGTVAGGNPWEFLHKVRAGQPGTSMPSAIVNGWSLQDVVDVLAHARSLPKE